MVAATVEERRKAMMTAGKDIAALGIVLAAASAQEEPAAFEDRELGNLSGEISVSVVKILMVALLRCGMEKEEILRTVTAGMGDL